MKREWLRRRIAPPTGQQGDRIVQNWDIASKDGVFNDWSVCVTALVRRREIHVLDVFRKKLEFPDLMRSDQPGSPGPDHGPPHRRCRQRAAAYPDAQQGPARRRPAADQGPVEKDKVTQMSAQSSRIEAGELLLPTEAAWLAEFERELIGFPSTRHDDQGDALVQLLEWTGQRPREPGVIMGGMVFEYS